MKGFYHHNEFKIGCSYGIAGGLRPTYKELKEEDAISENQANEIVGYFLNESKMDFQCIYNNCKNRAMVMSLMLREINIAHCKVWNFDPSKIALYNNRNKLNLEDPLGLKKEVYWDFHVAIAILVKVESNGSIEKYVIDPSFTHLALPLSKWLSKPNSPNSFYTFLDPEWYEFVTLQSNSTMLCNGKTSQITIPDCLPEIITGDFYRYSSDNIPTIADELAADKQITNFTHNVINKLNDEDGAKDQLIEFLTDFNNIDEILKGEKELSSSHPFYPYLLEYRESYRELYEYWLNKLDDLRV